MTGLQSAHDDEHARRTAAYMDSRGVGAASGIPCDAIFAASTYFKVPGAKSLAIRVQSDFPGFTTDFEQ